MSIIHEALKKTQIRLSNEKPKKQTKNRPKNNRPRNNKRLYFLILGTALVLVFFILMVSIFQTHHLSVNKRKVVEHSSTYPALAGIMMMEGHEVAIFDNQTYNVGETVAGNEIIKIQPDQVIVSHQGKLTTLQVGN